MERTTKDKTLPKPSPELQAAMMRVWGVIRQAGEIIVSLRDDNNSLAARVAELEETLQGYEARMNRDGDDIQRELSEVQGALRQKNEHIREMERELTLVEERNAENADLRQRLQQAYQDIGELKNAKEETERQMRDTDFLKAELVRRNTELNERIKETLDYKNRIAELEDKVLVLQKDDNALGSAREDLEALRAELNEVRQAYYAEKAANEQRMQEQEPYQADLFSIGEIEAEWRSKAQNLRAEIENLRTKKAELEQELFERNKELIRHQKSLNQHSYRISELENRQRVLDTEKREKEAEALQLRRQVDLLSTQLREARQQAQFHGSTSAETRGLQLQELQHSIRELEQERTNNREEIAGLEASLREAQSAQADEAAGRALNEQERRALGGKVKNLLEKVEGMIGDKA